MSLRAEARVLCRGGGQFVDRHLDQAIVLQRAVFDRIARVAGFFQIGRIESVFVDDHDSQPSHRFQVAFQGGGVHGDQRVHIVARREDIRAGKMDLKSADAGQRPGGARISAGKSGSVLISLPIRAEVSVNCVPANCMPSPLSPQNRTVTEGREISGLRWPATATAVSSVVKLMGYLLTLRQGRRCPRS